MKRSYLIVASLSLCWFVGCASTPTSYNRDRGALLGGLAGAALGAAVGENNDEPLAGAAIGAAAGALTGAAFGDTVDAEVARNNAVIEQQMGYRVAGAVTVDQVIAMSQSGLSSEVITTHIRANGTTARPTTDDLIRMKSGGVSDIVVNAFQSQLPVTEQPAVVAQPVSTRPVVVERHHFWGPGRYPPPRCRRRVSWGFSVAR